MRILSHLVVLLVGAVALPILLAANAAQTLRRIHRDRRSRRHRTKAQPRWPAPALSTAFALPAGLPTAATAQIPLASSGEDAVRSDDSLPSDAVADSDTVVVRRGVRQRREDHVYHRPQCRFVRGVDSDKLETFTSIEEMLASFTGRDARLRPCKICILAREASRSSRAASPSPAALDAGLGAGVASQHPTGDP